jgi:hypothetical protein
MTRRGAGLTALWLLSFSLMPIAAGLYELLDTRGALVNLEQWQSHPAALWAALPLVIAFDPCAIWLGSLAGCCAAVFLAQWRLEVKFLLAFASAAALVAEFVAIGIVSLMISGLSGTQ